MSNVKRKIVYSLWIHIELQAQGFNYITEMKNPKDSRYNCWVYEETPEFLKAFYTLVEGGRKNG